MACSSATANKTKEGRSRDEEGEEGETLLAPNHVFAQEPLQNHKVGINTMYIQRVARTLHD